jgi:hypothetical protein
MDRLYALLAVFVLAVAAAAAIYWFQRQGSENLAPAVTAGTTPAPAPAAEEKPAPAAEPAIKYPVAGPQPDSTSSDPRSAEETIADALVALLGTKKASSFLRLDDFARRVVATVDNLPRHHAAARLWPVNRTPGRFAVSGSGKETLVNADNARRYAPFVDLVESVDTGRAVALYERFYPLFQRSYEQLGYPGRYFNDRLVAVIDHLLETPDHVGPLKVELTEVKGSVQPLPPWLRYRLQDPELEALSAGQRMLLRTGPLNERRLKAKLLDIRRHLVRGSAPG